MTGLETIIRSNFEVIPIMDYSLVSTYINDDRKLSTITIPVFGEIITMPTMFLGVFMHMVRNEKCEELDAFVCTTTTNSRDSSYKSLDANIRNIFNTSRAFSNYWGPFVKVHVNPDKVYYCCKGAIFSDNLKPLVMLSWQIMKLDSIKYKFIQPVLEVDSKVFTQKEDAMDRYIINKIIPATLNIRNLIAPGFRYGQSVFNFEYTGLNYLPKVEIGNIPFAIEIPDIPSVSTTNKELLDIVLDNIDEVIQ